MNLLMKNNTIGYNTIVDDAEDKEAGEYHHKEDTTTISTKNRRRQMFLLVGGSVSVLVVLVLLFCATPASPSLPSSASSLSSLRTTALEDQCYPNGDACYAGYGFLNGGCCDTARCVRRDGGDFCYGYTDTSCVCVDNPTIAPSLPPTKSPTNPPTSPPTSPPTPPPSRPPMNAPTTPPPTSPPAECRPNGDPCLGGYPASFLPNGGCCDTTSCISQNSGDACELFTDTSCFCNDNPTTAPSSSPTQSPAPTPPPTPPPTPAPTPPPTPHTVYDPSQDFCFKATHVNYDGYCWYPEDGYPTGWWEGHGGRGYNDCGRKCTDFITKKKIHTYDPSRDYCFADNDNPGKYCWSYYHYEYCPCGNWKVFTAASFDNCGQECTENCC